MFGKIVIGIDGSEASETALKVACGIANKFDSELHILHIAQPQTVAFAMGAVAGYHAATTMPSEAEIQEASDKIISSGVEIAKAQGITPANTLTDRGDPAQVITGYAEGKGADLIVTGRRGLGNIGALVLGSTSAAISHKAKCAVLSVA